MTITSTRTSEPHGFPILQKVRKFPSGIQCFYFWERLIRDQLDLHGLGDLITSNPPKTRLEFQEYIESATTYSTYESVYSTAPYFLHQAPKFNSKDVEAAGSVGSRLCHSRHHH